MPIFLRHQLLRSGWRKIDACAKRDSSPRSLCPNPRSLGGGQPKKCRPEQARAAPGTLGFIPLGLGRGEYFGFPGRLLELISREREDSCSLLPFPSYSSSSTCRSGWGLVGSEAASVSWQPELPPTPSCSWAPGRFAPWFCCGKQHCGGEGDSRRSYIASTSPSFSFLQF